MSEIYTGPLGWVRDDAAVDAVCAQIEAGQCGPKRPYSFSAARPQLKGYWQSRLARGEKGVFLHRAEKVLFGKFLDADYQKRGTCVSRGTYRACQDTYFAQLVNSDMVGRKVQLMFEGLYGGCRTQPDIGNGRISGDGAVGGWGAKYVCLYGLGERQVIGEYDLTAAREDLAVLWGTPGKHVPKEVMETGANHKFLAHKCPTVDDMADALAAEKGIALCLPDIFGPRDEDGMSRPAGPGAHCTEANGVFEIDGHLGFCNQQSWSNANPKGPDVLRYDGGTEQLRPGGYGSYASDVARLLRNGGEAWAFELVEGNQWR